MVKEHNDNVSKLLLSSKDTLDRRAQIELAFRECKEAFLELSAGYLLLLENRKSASSLSSEVKNFVSNTVSKKLDSLLSRTTDYCKNCKNSNNGSVSRGSMSQSADKRSYASVVDSDPSRIRMARGHTLNISKSTNLIITPSAGKTEISSSSDTRNAVQRILKPSEFDLKVKRISATRNNGVRIEAHSVDLDKIKDSRVLEKAGLTLAQESKINPRVLIHGVPCHMTREDIKSDIIALNLRDVSSTELAQVRVVYLFPEKEGRKTTNCVMEVTFLGYLVNSEGTQPLPDRIKGLREYNLPKTARELRRYLGMLNFYRRFIPRAAAAQALLHDLLGSKKGATVLEWTAETKQAFEDTKNSLAQTALLAHPKAHTELALFTDASDRCVGAVLQQRQGEDWEPLAFYSKKLNPTEVKYSTFDRELLAIYLAIKYFKHMEHDKMFGNVPTLEMEPGNRLSRSGGSEDSGPIASGSGYLQLNALNLQSSTPMLGESSYSINQHKPAIRGGWIYDEEPNRPTYNSFISIAKKPPPRILEALPSYPHDGTPFKSPVRFKEMALKEMSQRELPSKLVQNNDNFAHHHPFHVEHACSPTY
ncbi:PREDICTED: uncharacterized protein LOC105450360 [Wasmannia auropunctata]|uniref:uncharacterized protein LOC105450360 n=1 Tax=Wasmannia auropunctata TaxID=64793 RepID=UPI0005EFB0AA|nr:PREDICTED: uncharacterized protein LOC105450360 [Wasmannia auropunctata]